MQSASLDLARSPKSASGDIFTYLCVELFHSKKKKKKKNTEKNHPVPPPSPKLPILNSDLCIFFPFTLFLQRSSWTNLFQAMSHPALLSRPAELLNFFSTAVLFPNLLLNLVTYNSLHFPHWNEYQLLKGRSFAAFQRHSVNV